MGRILYCHGGLISLRKIKENYKGVGLTEVDYHSTEDAKDAASFEKAIRDGGYRTIIVEDSLIVTGSSGAAVFTTQTCAALRELFDTGGSVIILSIEESAIFDTPTRLRLIFGMGWKFHNIRSGEYVCQNDAAGAHFSLAARSSLRCLSSKSNNLAVPKAEAMWAEMVPPEEEGSSAASTAHVQLRFKGTAGSMRPGHVGGVRIAVHANAAGGRVAWFGDASSAPERALVKDLASPDGVTSEEATPVRAEKKGGASVLLARIYALGIAVAFVLILSRLAFFYMGDGAPPPSAGFRGYAGGHPGDAPEVELKPVVAAKGFSSYARAHPSAGAAPVDAEWA